MTTTFKTIFKQYEETQLARDLALFETINETDVLNAIERPQRNITDFVALLSDVATPHLEAIALLSQKTTKERFGKTIQLYAPLYFSSECSNKCSYCSFSVDNKIVRKTLTIDELRREGKFLQQQGFSHVILVSGEDRRIITTEYIAECIHSLKDLFASVAIEVAPQDIKEYQIFAETGCDGVTVYQETYNREEYKKHHIAGKKRIFDYRIDTPDRACEAGMRNIGIGALFGLAPWKTEALSLFTHLSYLQKKYWKMAFTVAFPRLRDHVSQYKPLPEFELSDLKLVQMVCAFRLCFPDTGIVLSTRETPEFRDQVLSLGVTRMSAGSSTEVGGYTGEVEKNEPQFQISDHRSADEVYHRIKELGYDPVWKDWEGIMHANK